MKKTKVLIVYKNLSIGGVEKKIIKLFRNINKNIFDLNLALVSKTGLLLKQMPKLTRIFDLKGQGLFGSFISIIKLSNILRVEKPDVVFCLGDYPSALVSFAKILGNPKQKVVVLIPNLMSRWIHYLKMPRFRNIILKFTLARADRVVAVSQAIKNDLHTRYNIPTQKIKVIYNFLEKKDFASAVRDESGIIVSRHPVLIYVGRFVKEKNITVILQAMVRILKRLEVNLIILGDGPEKNELLSLVKQLGLSNYVSFYKPQSDLKNELIKSDLLILCSKTEGHPNIILESMASGTPVLVTNYLGVKELIQNNITGFIVPLNVTPEALAKKIIGLLKNKVKLKKVSKMAKKYVRKFSVTKIIGEYEKVFLGN